MTEQEWLESKDPQGLLDWFLPRRTLSERKLRLFGAACCRRIWSLLADPKSRRAVEVVENWVDGWATEAERIEADRTADEFSASSISGFLAANTVVCFRSDRHQNVRNTSAWVLEALAWADPNNEKAVRAEAEHQATLLRDIIGNPFHPVTLDSAFLPGRIRALAQEIYENRQMPMGTFDPSRMKLLGDALVEPGCHNEEVIIHCQSNTPHVRGCWVVDLLLGRE